MQLKPPVTSWERLSNAASRIGLPPAVLLKDIEQGKADVRVQRMGARGLIFVASNDISALQATLSWGAPR